MSPRAALCGFVSLLGVALVPRVAAAQAVLPGWVIQIGAGPASASADADAIVLFDSREVTVASDGQTDTRERRVLRILRPAGTRYGQLEIPFAPGNQLRSLHVWTRSPADKVYELKAADFAETGYDADAFSDYKFKIADAPGADPGALIAIETEYHARPFHSGAIWSLQEDIPIRQATYRLTLPPGWSPQAGFFRHADIAAVHNPGTPVWTWEVRDAAGLPAEPSMPAPRALAARMVLNYGAADSATAPAAPTAAWTELAAWFAVLAQDRMDQPAPLVARARELTARAATAYDRAAALLAFVQSDIRYVAIEIGIGGYQPHFAGQVLRNGYGDCKDKATLLASLLAAVGMRSRLVLVNTVPGVVTAGLPGLDFDHAVLAIEWPATEPPDPRLHSLVTAANHARYLIVDPTDRYTPLGAVRQHLQGNLVLLSGADGGLLRVPLAPPEENQRLRTGRFALDPAGGLAGDVTEEYTGLAAANRRAQLAALDAAGRQSQIERELASIFPGGEISALRVDNLDALDLPLRVSYHLAGAVYARAVGSLWAARPDVLATVPLPLGAASVASPRLAPVHYQFAFRDVDHFTLALPPARAISQLPPPQTLDAGFASFSAATTNVAGALVFDSTCTVREPDLDAARVSAALHLNAILTQTQRSTALLTAH